MASLIRTNLLSNERLDLPDFNNIENFVIEDFNAIMKFLMTGSSKVVTGFRIFQDSTTLVDNPTASPVYIKLAGSSVMHTSASGVPYHYVGASTLAAAQIDLVPNTVNYIEMELTVTTGAPDTRAFWDPSANNGEGAEFTQIVDTARNLTAVFTVNNIGFSGGTKLPIAEITMTGSVITSNKDRMNRFFALQEGQPADPSNEYPWTQGRAQPNADRILDPNAYIGADKSITTFKEWMDAIMTEIKLMKGGSYWFSPGSSLIPGVNVSDLFFDTKGSVLTGTGKFQHSDSTIGMLTWTSDLYIKSLYGKLALKINAGSVTLADEQVAYVQLVRNQDFQPANTFTFVNGSLTVNASLPVTGIVAGDWIKAESAGLNHWAQVDTVVGNVVTLLALYTGPSTVEKAVRTQGTYTTVTAANPTAVPMNGNVYVLGKRVDNGGSIPRIYLGGAGGGEIESGEEEDIGDDFSDDIFAFIGSAGKTDRDPNYLYLPNGLAPFTFAQGDNLVRAISICVANINDLMTTLDNPSYDESNHVTTGSGTTSVASNTGTFNGNYTLQDPAQKMAQRFDPTSGGTIAEATVDLYAVANPTGNLYASIYSDVAGFPGVLIEQSATALDMATIALLPGAAYTFLFNSAVVAPGTNYWLVLEPDPGSNLSAGNFIGANLSTSAGYPGVSSDYISGAWTPTIPNDFFFDISISTLGPNDIAPQSSGAILTIPVNSRLSGSPQQMYVVGKGALEVYLNGQYLVLGDPNGWTEVGAADTLSSQIEINQDLIEGDTLTFRLDATGGPGAGAGGGGAPDDDFVTLPTENTPDNADFVLIYDVTAAGYKKQTRGIFLAGLTNDLSVTTKTANYAASSSDNIINVDSTGGVVTITLPAAASTPGHPYYVKKIAGGLNGMNIVAVSGNIEGGADLNAFTGGSVADGDSFLLVSDGVNYWMY